MFLLIFLIVWFASGFLGSWLGKRSMESRYGKEPWSDFYTGMAFGGPVNLLAAGLFLLGNRD